MSKDKKDGKLGDSHGQVVFFGALLALAAIMRAGPHILGFLLNHETTIFILLSLLFLALATIGVVMLWNWYAKREQEKGITASDRTTGVLLGAGFGGVIGGLIGHESYKEQEKKDALKGLEGNSPGLEIYGNGSSGDKRPTLRPAQVKVHYVEDQVKDGTFVPAHFEYEIAEPARWEKSK